MSNEAFSRVLVDRQLADVGWNLADGQSVRYEYHLPDGTRADYVLCDRHGRIMAVVEAKRAVKNLQEAADQGRAYAEQLDDVPYVFLANGEEILFWNYQAEAYPRKVSTFFKQDDLERRVAKRKIRVDPLTKPIDAKIAGRDYQKECIDTLCREMNTGRRKLLVEMATGTGKTRTAAALIKRLFEDRAAGSTNQVELTAQMATTQVVPIPPLAEQHRIVAKVDELMVLCDALKARINDAQTTQIHLADAIVEMTVESVANEQTATV